MNCSKDEDWDVDFDFELINAYNYGLGVLDT